MTLEEILNSWETDSKINITDLDNESVKVSILHHKYLKILSIERLKLSKFKAILRNQEGVLYKYYNSEFNDNEAKLKELGREPIGNRILKPYIKEYVDSDKEIVDIKDKMIIIEEKVTVLNEIIKSISGRSFQIANALNWTKITTGGM